MSNSLNAVNIVSNLSFNVSVSLSKKVLDTPSKAPVVFSAAVALGVPAALGAPVELTSDFSLFVLSDFQRSEKEPPAFFPRLVTLPNK